jgi:hypothetical protein
MSCAACCNPRTSWWVCWCTAQPICMTPVYLNISMILLFRCICYDCGARGGGLMVVGAPALGTRDTVSPAAALRGTHMWPTQQSSIHAYLAEQCVPAGLGRGQPACCGMQVMRCACAAPSRARRCRSTRASVTVRTAATSPSSTSSREMWTPHRCGVCACAPFPATHVLGMCLAASHWAAVTSIAAAQGSLHRMHLCSARTPRPSALLSIRTF